MRRCRSKSAGRAGLVGTLSVVVVACVTYWAAAKLTAAPSDRWVRNPFPGWSLPSSLNTRAVNLLGRIRDPRPLRRGASSPSAPNTALHFDGIDDRNAAAQLAGLYCTVPLADARTLPSERYYHFQLVGLTVVDRRRARAIGQVAEVLTYDANDVLRVMDGDREVLIPMVRSVVRAISPAEGTINVDLPEDTAT